MKTVEVGQRIALKNVLFATDFSAYSNTALPYAVSIGRKFGAKLFVTHVVPTAAEMLLASPEIWPPSFEAEEKKVKECMEPLEKQMQGLPHEMVTARGSVSDALLQMISAHAIDLLVLGTHGRSGASKLLMGSVAEDVFRRAACPVLSVGPNVACTTDDEIRFHHILFATDLSDQSLAALPYALSLAEEDQAQLSLLHVAKHPPAGILDLEVVTASGIHLLKGLVPVAAESWCRVECLIEFDRPLASPAERILEIAEDRDVDLIVLGVRAVRGNFGLVTHLASTTAHVLSEAACPVLTVRG
jgi:nucleotide-binding universal stress UspA family protein